MSIVKVPFTIFLVCRDDKMRVQLSVERFYKAFYGRHTKWNFGTRSKSKTVNAIYKMKAKTLRNRNLLRNKLQRNYVSVIICASTNSYICYNTSTRYSFKCKRLKLETYIVYIYIYIRGGEIIGMKTLKIILHACKTKSVILHINLNNMSLFFIQHHSI